MGFQQLGITSLLISCSSKNADRGAFKLQGRFETKFKHWGKSFEFFYLCLKIFFARSTVKAKYLEPRVKLLTNFCKMLCL